MMKRILALIWKGPKFSRGGGLTLRREGWNKRGVAALLCVAMMMIAAGAMAASSGTVNESWTWTLDANGTLTISKEEGQNGIYYVTAFEELPWEDAITKITAVEVKEGVVASELYDAFSGLTKATRFKFPANFVTNQTTSIVSAFSGCTSLTSLDLSGWNTSAVENWNGAFAECPSLKTLDLSDCSTASATNMEHMFYKSTALETLIFGDGFVLPEGVTIDLPSAFVDDAGNVYTQITCDQAKNKTLSRVKNVQSVEGIFWWIDGDGQLTIAPNTSVDSKKGLLPNMQGTDDVPWHSRREDVKSVVVKSGVKANEHVSHMFHDMSACTSMDLTGLDMDGVLYMTAMFAGCRKLTNLTLPTSFLADGKAQDVEFMFENCESLTELDMTAWDMHTVMYRENLFRGCTGLETLIFGKEFVLGGDRVIDLPSAFVDDAGNVYTQITCDQAKNKTLSRVPTSGKGGADGGSYSWTLDANGKLTIYKAGTQSGELNWFGGEWEWPKGLEKIVTSVEIEQGIYAVRLEYIFSGFEKLTEVSFPKGILPQGKDVAVANMFSGCGALEVIEFGEDFVLHAGKTLDLPGAFADGEGNAYTTITGDQAKGKTLRSAYVVTLDEHHPLGAVKTLGVAKGETLTLPTPVREGYDFVHWNDRDHGVGAPFAGSITPTEDITLYAIWTPKAAAPTTTPLPPVDDLPKTGDGSQLGLWALLCAACVAAMVAVRKRARA